ncbi:hypothetical protein AVEN_250733-1 [Araneus ventricosus]|uniref:Uncharacterized protein n=1 Tax=Araneus ventricosus TaxID=182803 RepID=A0A4Y2DXP0_ARAVE|nr:hypothetical protein AVEN_250733-1 [Araneus ventricosus]
MSGGTNLSRLPHHTSERTPTLGVGFNLPRLTYMADVHPRSYGLSFHEFRPRFALFPIVGTGRIDVARGLQDCHRIKTENEKARYSLPDLNNLNEERPSGLARSGQGRKWRREEGMPQFAQQNTHNMKCSGINSWYKPIQSRPPQRAYYNYQVHNGHFSLRNSSKEFRVSNLDDKPQQDTKDSANEEDSHGPGPPDRPEDPNVADLQLIGQP